MVRWYFAGKNKPGIKKWTSMAGRQVPSSLQEDHMVGRILKASSVNIKMKGG